MSWESSVTVPGNTISAGSIDLEVGGQGVQPFQLGPLAPGQTTPVVNYQIKNTGTVDGRLRVEATNLQDIENGLIAGEAAGGDISVTAGELSPFVNVTISTPTATLFTGTLAALNTVLDGIITAGQTLSLDFQATLDQAAPEVAMTDQSTFNFTFSLINPV